MSAEGRFTTDPLAPLAELPGVSEAVERASDFIARAHRHPANLRGWDVTGSESVLRGAPARVDRASGLVARGHGRPANRRGWDATGAESVLRGARASAQLDGGTPRLPEDGQVEDPILAGSLRAAELLAPDGIAETR